MAFSNFFLRDLNIMFENVQKAPICICNDFINMHKNQFNQGIIGYENLNSTNIKDLYDQTVHALFDDNIYNWGRLVALFVFSGELACKCYHSKCEYLRDYIINWTDTFIKVKFKSWMDENDDWMAMRSVH